MKKDELLRTIRENYKIAIDFWDENFRRFKNSLEFLEGKSGHWDTAEQEKRSRRNQACLTMKVVNKYAKKLVGEIRLNKISINVTPGSKDADFQTAKAIKGKIKDIEYNSTAESIYDYMTTQIVEGGLAAMRILTYYKDDDDFEQDICMETIENPLCVLIDPNSKKPNFEDAEYVFITTTMSKSEFKRKYPKVDIPTDQIDSTMGYWTVDDQVIITEYYFKEYYTVKKVKLSNGDTMEKSEAEEMINSINERNMTPEFDPYGQPMLYEVPKIVKDRDVEKCRVKWLTCTGSEILSDIKTIPGKYIPVVFCGGEMRNIDNVKYYRGLIYDGIDAARMADYWYTAAAEMVALAPKAKYMLTPDEVKGFEKQFSSNDNVPYFLFNLDPRLGRPQLQQPDTPPTAILSQLAQAEENVKGSIGMYDTDLGDSGRELSGAAINARQTPSQVSNFVYYDNLTKAVAYAGKIIVSMLPEVIDTERDIEMRNDDDSQDFMPVNTTAGKAMEAFKNDPEKYGGVNVESLKKQISKEGLESDFNNLAKGKYNVYVSTGPAYQTQRIEAAQRYIELMGLAIQAQSQTGLVTLYYAAKNMDMDGADEYAEAIRKMLPYGVLKPKPGEQPPPPPQPSPEQQMQAEILMLERRNQEAKSKVEEQRLKTEMVKQQRQILDAQIDLEKAKITNQTTIAKTMNDINKTVNQGMRQ
jgi:hypothetical protein